MTGALGEDVVERRDVRVSGVKVVELVPGREIGDDTLRECIWRCSRSARSVRFAAFLLLEEGRGREECSGFPNANPTAATPTVLEATSYARKESMN